MALSKFHHKDCAITVSALFLSGGYVACDDYGWPGGRRAIDEFAQRSGVAVATNEFNQAWLRKP